jgi:hypothetical protein
VVQGQSGQKVHETPSQPMAESSRIYLLSKLHNEVKNRRIKVKASLNIKQDPISKITNAKRVGRVAQVVECLPSKHEVELSSTSSIKKKKKKNIPPKSNLTK